jgi:hypothetical protein
MSRLVDLYCLRAAVAEEIDREEKVLLRRQRLASEIAIVCDEEPDVPLEVSRRLGPASARLPDTHTDEEARACHAAYGRGWRDEWTEAGEKQWRRKRRRVLREVS